MTRLNFAPLYRNSTDLDQLAALRNTTRRNLNTAADYPAYDIEIHDDNHYAITLAVAGFSDSELEVQVEKGVLTVQGKRASENDDRKYLHNGIASRSFELKFNLADHIEVSSADLDSGLLRIELLRRLPEEMKPRSIAIRQSRHQPDYQTNEDQAA